MKQNRRHTVQRLLVIGWTCAAMVALGGYSVQGVLTAMAEEPTWLTASPILETLREPIPSAELPYRTSGNRDCQRRISVTRPKRITVVWPFVQSEQTKPACAVDTAYGAIDEQGYLQRASTNISGIVKDQTGAQAVVVAVPRSSDMLLLDKRAPGQTVYVYMYRNVQTLLKTVVSPDGSVTHQLTEPPTTALRDERQQLLGVQFDSAAFSANGRWLVVDIPGRGLSRIDLTTMAVTPFVRWPIGYDSGSNPSYQTAVSGQGRFTVVSSTTYNLLKLFDVNSCTQPLLAMYQTCASIDLQAYLAQRLPGFIGATRIRFIDETSLDFYATRKIGGSMVYGHYLLHVPGHKVNAGYMGLGDSFSSGEGAYDYKNGTDTSQNKCHLSLQSYPFVLGRELGLSTYQSVACSGAEINDFIYSDRKIYNTNLAQAEGKEGDSFNTEIYDNYLPGYRVQESFIEKTRPGTITLTAGGNNIGFGDIVKRCVGPDTCYQSREERQQLLTLIDEQFDQLANLYQRVQQASGDAGTRVYVVGYPEVAQPEGNCAANVHLNKGELYFANELVDYLNSVIQQAAAKAGVFYVDVGHALEGHRLCETDSWNVAVNGLTAGNDVPAVFGGPIANESFHPNKLGQWLLAAAIRQQTQDLTAAMPVATTGSPFMPHHDQLSIIQNAPPSDAPEATPPRAEVYREGPTVINRGEAVTLTATGSAYGLRASSPIDVSLHSDPTHLATAQTDVAGNLTATVTLPGTVPVGYHTLHLYAQNVAGEAVDLFKTVLVTNGQDSAATGHCVVVPDSGIDQDRDGVDDACDAVIGEPAAIQAALTVAQQTAHTRETVGSSDHTARDASLAAGLSTGPAADYHQPHSAGATNARQRVLGSQSMASAVSALLSPTAGMAIWLGAVVAIMSVGLVIIFIHRRHPT